MACRSLLRAMRSNSRPSDANTLDTPLACDALTAVSMFSPSAKSHSIRLAQLPPQAHPPASQPPSPPASPPPPPSDGDTDSAAEDADKLGKKKSICKHKVCHRVACFAGEILARRLCSFAVMGAKWLWYSWVDIATILSTTGLALVLYMTPPPASRSFTVTDNNGNVMNPDFALPLRKEIVPSWLAIFLGPAVPVLCILALQVRIRSFWDANNAVFGVLYSLTNSVLFQVVVKWLIGGLRPHFLDVCKPDLSLAKTGKSRYNAAGFQEIYYTRDVCTGDKWQINDSLTSFPSGHTTAAFAGFVFLSLYMNGKFKIFSNKHTPLWKLSMFNAPILFATLIGGALTIDAFHNWYDIVAGAILGTFMAFTSYRMTYAAVFDYRYNHIPMNRNKSFDYASIDSHESDERHFGLTHLDNSRL